MLQVRDIMSRAVRAVRPQATVSEALALMTEEDIGLLPVIEAGRLVGVLTRRDLARRSESSARGVRALMTPGVQYCYEDDPAAAALDYMRRLRVRELPVLARDERVCGVLCAPEAAHRPAPKPPPAHAPLPPQATRG